MDISSVLIVSWKSVNMNELRESYKECKDDMNEEIILDKVIAKTKCKKCGSEFQFHSNDIRQDKKEWMCGGEVPMVIYNYFVKFPNCNTEHSIDVPKMRLLVTDTIEEALVYVSTTEEYNAEKRYEHPYILTSNNERITVAFFDDSLYELKPKCEVLKNE